MHTTTWGRSLADVGAPEPPRPGDAFPERSAQTQTQHCAHHVIDLQSRRPAREARHWAEEWLAKWPLPEAVRYDASVVVSELVTNAVQAPVTVPANLVPDPSPVLAICIYAPDSARLAVSVTVSDFAMGGPEPRAADDEQDEDGRGLVVVAGLAESVSIHRGATTADGVVSALGKRIVAVVA